MIKYRSNKRNPTTRTNCDANIDAQTTAARDSATQAKRAVTVAWVGVFLNMTVVATALIVPMLQREWTEYDKKLEGKQQDRRALIAGYSRLVEASSILGDGGLLDMNACPSLTALNALDRARSAGVTRRMSTLNQAIFPGGAPSPVQSDIQAGMIRIYDSVEGALFAIQTIPTSTLSKAQRVGICRDAIADTTYQSLVMRDRLLINYQLYRQPTPPPYPLGRATPSEPIITEQEVDFIQSIDNIPFPELVSAPPSEAK